MFGITMDSSSSSSSYVNFTNELDPTPLPYTTTNPHWNQNYDDLKRKKNQYKNLCLVSVVFAFSVGLTIGILIPLMYFNSSSSSSSANNMTSLNFQRQLNDDNDLVNNNNNSSSILRTIFLNNSYLNTLPSSSNADDNNNSKLSVYSAVSFVKNTHQNNHQHHRTSLSHSNNNNNYYVENDIYWGEKVESALPAGYKQRKHTIWTDYINRSAVAIRLENGCGRMQNRLVTFRDGLKGCVRYRQNIDQIQGELFSFYLAQILQLPNLAPSAVSIVDLNSPLWTNLHNEIAAAQWNSNRPIVLTQFISNLNSANIPAVFKPLDRHLNKLDVYNVTMNKMFDNVEILKSLVELAQWSDLIVFDYLTANLDRIVNNLYNYQWNINIMDAPAHNLAKQTDSDLLVFLDNESGLLHGYRLLKKYEMYHSILLDNLCMFRRQTANIIKTLKTKGNIGTLLRGMFEQQNSDIVKDILPTLPDKSVKILNERIDRVYGQIMKCESIFSNNT